MSVTYNIKMTAYAAAVEGGYTGTYEEFCIQQATYAGNVALVTEKAGQVATNAAQVAADKDVVIEKAGQVTSNAETVAQNTQTTVQALSDVRTLTNTATAAADNADRSERNAANSESNASDSAEAASRSAQAAAQAQAAAEQAASGEGANALKSEGFAVGEQNGAPVGDTSPYYHNNAAYYAGQASGSADTATTKAGEALRSASDADGAKTTAVSKAGEASISASAAAADALKSEGYAVGKQNGTDVDSESTYYHNNSKYFANQASGSETAAAASALESEGFAVGKQNGTDVASGSPYYQNNAAYYAGQAASSAAASAAMTGLAPAFSTSQAYSAGDYVLYSGTLYRFTSAHAAGAWTGTDATAVTLGPDVSSLKSDITDMLTHHLVLGNFVPNSYVKRDGTFAAYNGWKRTGYVDVSNYTALYGVTSVNTTNNVIYDGNYNIIYAFTVDVTEKMWSLPENAKYAVFSNTNAGMDDLVVRGVYRLEEENAIVFYNSAEKSDSNALNNAKGGYSNSGVSNVNNNTIHATLPTNTAYVRNVYNGKYIIGVWDTDNTFLGFEYADGFVSSGNAAGEYFQDYANVKKMFDDHPNCTLRIVYTSRVSETLINKPDFNEVYQIYIFPDAVLSAADVVKNTFSGTYCDTDIDSKLLEYGGLVKNSGVSDSFLFFTDPHPFYTAAGLNTGWKNGLFNKMPLIEKAYNSTGTAFCLCGGDWLGNSDTPEVACTKLGFVSGMMKHFFDKYYMMNGNHDTNYQGTTELTTNALINSMFADFGRMYYHFDTPNAKYYIFDSGKDNNNSMTAYRWEQIDWFATQLIENDDTHNVIGIHIVTNQYQADFESSPVFQNFVTNVTAVADAYNSKGAITLNSVTYNFTNTNGKVDFAIAGHSHFDAITELNNIPIMITTWVRAGSVSTFDLVLADYTAGTVKTVRIGSGLNRIMSMA